MRFMVIVKADKNSEAGVLPDRKMLTEMGKFNEELAKAGVMLAGEGLHASSKGARVRFSGDKRTVIDGPFSETKELIAGFWLWQVRSKEEAIEWLKRAPFREGEVEIRQVFESEDFGAEFTPELRQQEEKIRKQVAAKMEWRPCEQTRYAVYGASSVIASRLIRVQPASAESGLASSVVFSTVITAAFASGRR